MKATVETKIAVIMNPESRVTIVSFGIWQKENTATTQARKTRATIVNLGMWQKENRATTQARTPAKFISCFPDFPIRM